MTRMDPHSGGHGTGAPGEGHDAPSRIVRAAAART